jgi:hypothetical protein
MLAARAAIPAARTAAASVDGTASPSEEPSPKPVPTTAVTMPAVPTIVICHGWNEGPIAPAFSERRLTMSIGTSNAGFDRFARFWIEFPGARLPS